MAKVADYRQMDASGLNTTLQEMEAELFDLKFQNTLSKLENVSLIRQKRKDIARVKTIMREKAEQEKGKA